MDQVAHVIREIRHFQSTSYKIEHSAKVNGYLLDPSNIVDDEDLYQMSLEIEPRQLRLGSISQPAGSCLMTPFSLPDNTSPTQWYNNLYKLFHLNVIHLFISNSKSLITATLLRYFKFYQRSFFLYSYPRSKIYIWISFIHLYLSIHSIYLTRFFFHSNHRCDCSQFDNLFFTIYSSFFSRYF